MKGIKKNKDLIVHILLGFTFVMTVYSVLKIDGIESDIYVNTHSRWINSGDILDNLGKISSLERQISSLESQISDFQFQILSLKGEISGLKIKLNSEKSLDESY